jgi:hypothetical protein
MLLALMLALGFLGLFVLGSFVGLMLKQHRPLTEDDVVNQVRPDRTRTEYQDV